MIQHIPNTLTLFNLLSGCIGVFACATSNYKIVPICIALSLIADFLDGLVARALNVKSELGGQLDSLADMVSFGVLPGTMLLQLISMSKMGGGGSYDINPIAYTGFGYSVFACLRLAKFNLDTRQTESFIGLATPAGAIFVLGLYMNFFEQNFQLLPTLTFKLIYQPLTLISVTGLLAYLMISEIPMFSLKGSLFKWQGNQIRLLFLLLSVITLISLGSLGLTAVIVLYILLSVVQWITSRSKAMA